MMYGMLITEQIRLLAICLNQAIRPPARTRGVGTAKLLKLILRIMHPDKWIDAGPRQFYATMTSNTLVTRCLQAILACPIMDMRPMPGIVITQFSPDRCDIHPSLDFEQTMAAFTATRSGCMEATTYRENVDAVKQAHLRSSIAEQEARI